MTVTRTRRLAQADDLPPCAAEIVHEFADGWTIRTLQTLGDVHREGALMSNCLAFDADDVVDLRRCLGESWHTDQLEDDGFDAYRSLRDADNLPHLTCRADEDSRVLVVQEILGRHNAEPRREHFDRLCAWAAATGKDSSVYLVDHHLTHEHWWHELTSSSYDALIAHQRRTRDR